jgi:phage tail-like protein
MEAVASVLAVAYRYEVYTNRPGGPIGLRGGFSKVSGIKEEIEVDEKRDGADPFQTVKNIGQFKGGTLQLSKGVVDNINSFYNWFDTVKSVDNAPFRETVTLEVHNPVGDVALKMRFLRAWPTSYELGEMNAMSSGVAMESLSIAFEKAEMDSSRA